MNGGTLLVNNTLVPAPERSRNGQQRWHYPWRNRHNQRRGHSRCRSKHCAWEGGNNTAILSTGPLTLLPNSNFRVDINGTTPGSGYDRLNVATGSYDYRIAILWSQSARHCRSADIYHFEQTPRAPSPAHLRGFPKGAPWWAATVPFSRSVTPEAMATTSCSRLSRRRPRTEHMDRRRACDRRARVHSASQTAKVNSVQSIVTRESFRS